MYLAFKKLKRRSELSKQWSKSEKESTKNVFGDKERSSTAPIIFWNVKILKEMQQRWFYKL